jgi:hypothetical protein
MHLRRPQRCHPAQGALDERMARRAAGGIAIGAGIHFDVGYGLLHKLHGLAFVSHEECRSLVEFARHRLE